MIEGTCPACGNHLARYGCVDVEQVGSFCRGPVPPRPRTMPPGPRTKANVCEHGDHPAPDGARFCSYDCERCEHDSVGINGCDGLCRIATGPAHG